MPRYVMKRYTDAGRFIRSEHDGAYLKSVTYWHQPGTAPATQLTIELEGKVPVEEGPRPGCMVINSDTGIDWLPEDKFRQVYSEV